MISKLTSLIVIIFCITATPNPKSAPTVIELYGNAKVSTVHRLDEHVRLYCDISDFPPIIGQDIPVCIKGLKPAANPQDNLKLLMFLNDLFLSKNDKPEKIMLKNIQRGEQFCLVADIEIDGQDLCDLLIEKKLAQKVIEVSQPKNPASNAPPQNQTRTNSAPAAADAQYIASKSSKIYHRSTCTHAKRMDTSKSVTFTTRDAAESTGRRPCKTCKP